MKEFRKFSELFEKNHGQELDVLRRTADVAGRESPKHWEEYVKQEILSIMLNDNALADEMLDSVCELIVNEFRLMPDPNYKLTDEDKAICGLGAICAIANILGLNNDDDKKENK